MLLDTISGDFSGFQSENHRTLKLGRTLGVIDSNFFTLKMSTRRGGNTHPE